MSFLFRRQIYLDHNATTPVSRPVRQVMNRVLNHYWGNPSSGYQAGKIASQVIEDARSEVAKAMHAHAHEVYFTGCATEANNWVIQMLSRLYYPQKKKIIATPIEHSSVRNTLEFLKSQGVLVEYCPVDDQGFVPLEALGKMVDEDTFLVCCMLANNEIGTVQDVQAITALAKQRGALVLSDCVPAFGKIPVDVKKLGVDYATFSAHKLYGPKGVGALYARISSPLEPLIYGGGQEEGMRAGTESVHNIAGFGRACREVDALLMGSDQIRFLKELLAKLLLEAKPDIILNSPTKNCLPNTLSVTFTGISSRELMLMLDDQGIAVSSGSACSSQSHAPSPVLKAIGISEQASTETIRFSLGHHTSERDIRYTARVINRYLQGRDG